MSACGLTRRGCFILNCLHVNVKQASGGRLAARWQHEGGADGERREARREGRKGVISCVFVCLLFIFLDPVLTVFLNFVFFECFVLNFRCFFHFFTFSWFFLSCFDSFLVFCFAFFEFRVLNVLFFEIPFVLCSFLIFLLSCLISIFLIYLFSLSSLPLPCLFGTIYFIDFIYHPLLYPHQHDRTSKTWRRATLKTRTRTQ